MDLNTFTIDQLPFQTSDTLPEFCVRRKVDLGKVPNEKDNTNPVPYMDEIFAVSGGEEPVPPTPEYKDEYLTIEGYNDGSYLYFIMVDVQAMMQGQPSQFEPRTIQWSKDKKTWNTFTATTVTASGTSESDISFDFIEPITELHKGDKIYLKGNNKTYAQFAHIPFPQCHMIHTLPKRFNHKCPFVQELPIEPYHDISGNIMSLIYGDDFKGKTELTAENEYAFSFIFGAMSTPDVFVHSVENLVLPATTLANSCYYGMFQGCRGLTTAPELPATTLADKCYYGMFTSCTSLTTAPELPATTLANYCYADMFHTCTSLTTAPVLPATTLANNCYYGMFYNCSSLTSAPELPATTLASYCYSDMFRGCTSLTTAPELPAATLTQNCYNYMFQGCRSLNYIKCLAINNINTNGTTSNWVYGVASSGVFEKHPDASWPTGNSGIPDGWVSNLSEFIPDTQLTTENYLTFNINEDGYFGLAKISSYQTMYLSKDLTDWVTLNTTTGPKVYSVNKNETIYACGVLNGNNSLNNNTQFAIIGNISVNGNLNSLWNYEDLELPLYDYCGYNLFSKCNGLINADRLTLGTSTTELADYCYSYMFWACTNLITVPELPATALTPYCYEDMFYGCKSLTIAPELPATILANYCYSYMFNDCTSLTTAPELPATALTENCYISMFYKCTSLTTAPELPATTLADRCYGGMFNGCTSLTTAPELHAITLAPYCYSSMFWGCRNVNYIKCLAVNGINTNGSTDSWVSGVQTNSGTFVKSPNATSWPTADNGIPTNWTVEDATA